MFFKKKRNKYDKAIMALDYTKETAMSFPPIRERRMQYRIFAFIKLFCWLVVLSILALILLLGFNFLKFKIIYQNAMVGKDNLEYAVGLIKQKDYESASEFASMAERNFQDSSAMISVYAENYVVRHIPFLYGQADDFVYLLSTAEILSRAVKEGAEFGAGFDNIINNDGATYASLSKNEKRQILKKIYESAPELNGIKANIELALLNLNNVHTSGIMWPFKSKIAELNKQLVDLKYVFDKAIPLSQVVPVLLGYPQKSSFLVLLQNRDELRPTGGFIGTYGILQLEDSEILRSDTHDIYHMDMPVKDKINIEPPRPIKKYLVDKWYMRDSNWSPDWPASAAQIEKFYKLEDPLLPAKDQVNKFDGEFDGIIGLNVQLIIDVLEMTGPVKIENVEYNKDNFDKVLEYRVEKGYEKLGVPSWQRKEVIGDIVKVLEERIMAMPLSELYKVAKIFDKNMSEKNILVYMKDAGLQEIVRDENWAGEIKDAKGDYLMIVDANMASFKTDAVIKRKIDYKLDQDASGLAADLLVTYSHNGKPDWRTTRYRTYVRFYVPLGSALIEAEGFKEEPVTAANDFGKTVFSGFTVIEPGQIGTVHLRYKLPEDLNTRARNGDYSLYLQKQPGSIVESAHLNFVFLNNIRTNEPTGYFISRYNNTLNWETDLNTDKNLILKLK